jgi:hypothetical protein
LGCEFSSTEWKILPRQIENTESGRLGQKHSVLCVRKEGVAEREAKELNLKRPPPELTLDLARQPAIL